MCNEIRNIYFWNANSISNKFEEIILALNENEIDMLALNETKIDKKDKYLVYFWFFRLIFHKIFP